MCIADSMTLAIGVPGSLPADTWLLRPAPGDRYLLCTDGLTNEVADGRIADLLARAPDAAAAVEGLVSQALDGGGRDNVSAVAVFCEGARIDP